MPRYLNWLDIAGYVFGALTLFCLLRMRRQGQEQRNTTLLARAAGGLLLCSIGASTLLTGVVSPRSTISGSVTGFHQVREYRSQHFEFRLARNNELSVVLRANYFDKGFYFGDPAVSDGDAVEATYAKWTNEVIQLREVAGRHPGWTFSVDPHPVGPWLLLVTGILLVLSGILGKLSDLADPTDLGAFRDNSH